jgi:hypothetical protein
MPLIKIKLFQDDTISSLKSNIAAYKAGLGSDLASSQRAMALDAFVEADGDKGLMLALAHGGLDVPASKIADLDHLVVRASGEVSAIQGAVDAALADVVHKTVADGNANTTPGSITSATMAFEAEDVGRGIVIDGQRRTITSFGSGTAVAYSGPAITGTGLTVSLLGAEVLQGLEMSARKGRAGGFHMTMALAVNGELA